ncbi:MAG TPA: cellulase family glycosylhydrolase, partial [Polyangiales bacterium]
MKTSRLWRLAPLVVAGWAASSARADSLHVEGPYFRDPRGAVVVLRGFNVAGDAKVPPFRPVDDPRMFDVFAGYGVNVARLLFSWEAFESSRGTYDEGYFDYYEGLIDALHERGVRVIVDFHQDAFSRFATDGCGEGMPEWAISPRTTKHAPDNGPSCASWGIKFILDGDTHKCWDDFYADAQGVRTSYLNMLKTVARRLRGHEAVLGYDILNEPWADEVKQLAPFYDEAARVLRAEDQDAILFVSPQGLTSAGQETKLPRPSFDNFAYSPHFYDGAVVQLQIWFGGSLAGPVNRMAQQAQRWNVPLFVGEFGAPGEGNNVAAYMDEFYAQLDAQLLSAAQWSFVAHWHPEKKDGWNTEDFSVFDGSGAPRATLRVRAYPARIAGTPIAFKTTRSPESTVELAWQSVPAQGETRIFAPHSALFSSQAFVETHEDVTCSYEENGLYLRCTSATEGEKRIVLRACGAGEVCVQTDRPTAP